MTDTAAAAPAGDADVHLAELADLQGKRDQAIAGLRALGEETLVRKVLALVATPTIRAAAASLAPIAEALPDGANKLSVSAFVQLVTAYGTAADQLAAAAAKTIA